ncbi:hypothetical protein F5X96DRAFT_616451 [Biscogniauxia mediterranea]|nr:hypothetical protein F5X96DRAFT_616451 [Biscogniauxia mediterranea]
MRAKQIGSVALLRLGDFHLTNARCCWPKHCSRSTYPFQAGKMYTSITPTQAGILSWEYLACIRLSVLSNVHRDGTTIALPRLPAATAMYRGRAILDRNHAGRRTLNLGTF